MPSALPGSAWIGLNDILALKCLYNFFPVLGIAVAIILIIIIVIIVIVCSVRRKNVSFAFCVIFAIHNITFEKRKRRAEMIDAAMFQPNTYG